MDSHQFMVYIFGDYGGVLMRLSISVNYELLEAATKISGSRTKREAIELALNTLIMQYRRSKAIQHAGAFHLTLTPQKLRQLRQQE